MACLCITKSVGSEFWLFASIFNQSLIIRNRSNWIFVDFWPFPQKVFTGCAQLWGGGGRFVAISSESVHWSTMKPGAQLWGGGLYVWKIDQNLGLLLNSLNVFTGITWQLRYKVIGKHFYGISNKRPLRPNFRIILGRQTDQNSGFSTLCKTCPWILTELGF